MARVAGGQNLAPATGAEAMYLFTEYMVNIVGWTITAQSDGSGAAITHGGSGANGFANNFAYRELRDPANKRYVVFQRSNTANTHWRIKMTESGTTSGGTATQVPAGTPTVTIVGGGTDASPTFSQLLHTDGTYRFHAVADTAPVTGSDVYPFWFGCHILGDVYAYSIFLFDGLLSGSYHPSDQAPWYVFSNYQTTSTITCWPVYNVWGGTALFSTHSSTSGRVTTLMSASFTGVVASLACGSNSTSGSFTPYNGTNYVGEWAYNGDYGGIGCYVYRTQNNGVPYGFKGITAWLKVPFRPLNTGDTIGLSTTDAYIYWGQTPAAGGGVTMIIPWVQNVIPVL